MENLVRDWQEAAELVKEKALVSSDGEGHVKLRLVDLNLDGSNVHGIYEGSVRYHADEDLSVEELVKVVRERFMENRDFVRNFEIGRGHEHLIIHSVDVAHVDGFIVW